MPAGTVLRDLLDLLLGWSLEPGLPHRDRYAAVSATAYVEARTVVAVHTAVVVAHLIAAQHLACRCCCNPQVRSAYLFLCSQHSGAWSLGSTLLRLFCSVGAKHPLARFAVVCLQQLITRVLASCKPCWLIYAQYIVACSLVAYTLSLLCGGTRFACL
jgi:hypothetical protein